MARDAEQTKQRLLEAAISEFAAYGIAGARVDRVAAAAGCNKAMIYSYFGSKEGLFDAAFDERTGAFFEAVPFDAGDLAGYTGRAFDYFDEHPETLRLSTWYRLERSEAEHLAAITEANDVRLREIGRAQHEGEISGHFSPVQLLVLIQALSAAWHSTNPELGPHLPSARAGRRRTLVDAVQGLLALK
ncbi:TetR family transcriptional regulator [Amycolatopsis sp. NPDC051372]|uniref:TetR family transcriptional regulator n=1 Tax=unclassified Amycolatopsis TaxID=2618356 RepID=UPI003425DBF1